MRHYGKKVNGKELRNVPSYMLDDFNFFFLIFICIVLLGQVCFFYSFIHICVFP